MPAAQEPRKHRALQELAVSIPTCRIFHQLATPPAFPAAATRASEHLFIEHPCPRSLCGSDSPTSNMTQSADCVWGCPAPTAFLGARSHVFRSSRLLLSQQQAGQRSRRGCAVLVAAESKDDVVAVTGALQLAESRPGENCCLAQAALPSSQAYPLPFQSNGFLQARRASWGPGWCPS